MPYLTDVHIDQFLTGISFAYTNSMLIGDQIFPPFNVDHRSDVYVIYGTESFKKYEDTRRPGTDAIQIKQTLSRGQYLADEHAVKDIVPDAEKVEADSPLSPEIDRTVFLTDTERNQREFKQLAVASDPTIVTANTPLSGTAMWDDYTNSVPLTNIRTGRSAVRAAIHKEATDIAFAYDASLITADHPSIKDLIKFTDPSNLSSGGLPTTIRGLTTHISGADEDTAGMLAAATFSPAFSKAVLIYFKNPNRGLRTITFGLTLECPDQTTGARGIQVRKWVDQEKKGTWIEVSDTYVPKVIAPLGAYLFTNVNT